MITPKIIYEDEGLLVIDKPYGVVVNKSDTQHSDETVQDWVEKKLNLESKNEIATPRQTRFAMTSPTYDKEEEFYDRGGIVHRLDKDTSGVLLIAKNPKTFEILQEQFKKRKVSKEYLALVHGDIQKIFNKEKNQGALSFTIDAPIARNPKNRMKWAVVAGGKEARTIFNFQFLIFNEYGKYSFIKCIPETGRTHQIRVHLASLGFPIVGDLLYTGKKMHRIDLSWCSRMFLHATKLCIVHPSTKKRVEFTSPLSSELEKLLKNF